MADDDDYYSYADDYQEDEEMEADDDDDDGSDPSEFEPDQSVTMQDKSKPLYKILTEEDIRRRQKENVGDIRSVLALSPAKAAALLCYYNWDVEKAKDAWFGDEKSVREQVGFFDKPVVEDRNSPKILNCQICFNTYRRSKFASVSCGHLFCSACWKIYIKTSINDGLGSLLLRCPSPRCKAIVDGDMVFSVLDTTDEMDIHCKAKYTNYFLRSYIESGKKIKWCPAPRCNHAIEHEPMGAGNYDVTCNCGNFFCWNCFNEAHRPVSCGLVEKWALKNSSEVENNNWIIANSKPCPMCKRHIEKNEGCMHMTCSAPCRHQFCWLCLGPWKAHGEGSGGYYSCNRYDSNRQEYEDQEAAREKLKADLKRYVHYYERWVANHTLRQTALKRLQETKDFGVSKLREKYSYQVDADLNFLDQSWAQIAEFRRVLKWSYVYGYYLPQQDQEKKIFFECLQGEAEQALVRLHDCVETAMKYHVLEADDVYKYNYHNSGESSSGKVERRSLEEDKAQFEQFRSEVARLKQVTNHNFSNLCRGLEDGLSLSIKQCNYYTNNQLLDIFKGRVHM